MAKKKASTESTEVTEENQAPKVVLETPTDREMLQLYVGVNFTPEGKSEEIRIEPGFIKLDVLPAAFQNKLIEKKQARIRLN